MLNGLRRRLWHGTLVKTGNLACDILILRKSIHCHYPVFVRRLAVKVPAKAMVHDDAKLGNLTSDGVNGCNARDSPPVRQVIHRQVMVCK